MQESLNNLSDTSGPATEKVFAPLQPFETSPKISADQFTRRRNLLENCSDELAEEIRLALDNADSTKEFEGMLTELERAAASRGLSKKDASDPTFQRQMEDSFRVMCKEVLKKRKSANIPVVEDLPLAEPLSDEEVGN